MSHPQTRWQLRTCCHHRCKALARCRVAPWVATEVVVVVVVVLVMVMVLVLVVVMVVVRPNTLPPRPRC